MHWREASLLPGLTMEGTEKVVSRWVSLGQDVSVRKLTLCGTKSMTQNSLNNTSNRSPELGQPSRMMDLVAQHLIKAFPPLLTLPSMVLPLF